MRSSFPTSSLRPPGRPARVPLASLLPSLWPSLWPSLLPSLWPSLLAGLLGALVAGGGSLAFPRAAFAAPDEGAQGEDISSRVKRQMDKIIEMMRQNEAALLELSTGGQARTTAPDVVPPPPDGDAGTSGTSERSGGGAAGKSAEERLRELVRTSRQDGARIPQELEELVRMVPQ